MPSADASASLAESPPIGPGPRPPGIGDAELTELLHAWRDGSSRAADELTRRVYPELRRIAAALRRGERSDLTLDPTDVVHEAWLALAGGALPDWQDRAHFFGIAARVMRRVLVAHARRRARHKRGPGARRVPLDDVVVTVAGRELDLLVLDFALARLSALDELSGRIVELRFFAGLSLDEVAAVVGLGRTTVVRKWRAGRAWLHRELDGG